MGHRSEGQLDVVGIFGCAPTPLSAELHLLAMLQTQRIGNHSLGLVGATSALHLAPRVGPVRSAPVLAPLDTSDGLSRISSGHVPIGVNPQTRGAPEVFDTASVLVLHTREQGQTM